MPWVQTLGGRALDLLEPVVDRAMIREDVAAQLSRIARFAGATCLPYSVAQHSVVAAQGALDETGDGELAAFLLLHDAHEFAIGDWTTPGFHALVALIDRRAAQNGVGDLARQAMAHRLRHGLADLKRGIDRAIVEAAGLSFKRFEAAAEIIAAYDLRALKSEKIDLLRPAPRRWATAVEEAPRLKTRGMIRPWTSERAEREFRDAFDRLCPEIAVARPALGQPRTAA